MRRLPLLGERGSLPTGAGSRARVLVSVAGAVDDAAALRFATLLAEALDAPLWRAATLAGPGAVPDPIPEGDHPVVAVGAGLAERVSARLRVVVTGGVPRAAWRHRGLEADLELAEPREGVARGLAAALRASPPP